MCIRDRCSNVNRVCFIAGDLVREQILDITPTFLTSNVLSTIRQADYVATQVNASFVKLLIYYVCIFMYTFIIFTKKNDYSRCL